MYETKVSAYSQTLAGPKSVFDRRGFTVRERAYGFMNTRIFIPLGFIWTYQRQKFNPNLTSEIKVKYPAKCIICIAHTFKKDKIAGFLS